MLTTVSSNLMKFQRKVTFCYWAILLQSRFWSRKLVPCIWYHASSSSMLQPELRQLPCWPSTNQRLPGLCFHDNGGSSVVTERKSSNQIVIRSHCLCIKYERGGQFPLCSKRPFTVEAKHFKIHWSVQIPLSLLIQERVSARKPKAMPWEAGMWKTRMGERGR